MTLSATGARQDIETRLPLLLGGATLLPSAEDSTAAHTPDEAVDETPAAKGDKDLALVFAKALHDIAKTGPSFDGTDKLDDIPPDSTFGQWWTHLHKLLKNPQFVDWARHKNIDLSKPLSISSFGHFTATAGGRRQTFRAVDKDPLWDTVVAPLLRATDVVAAGKNPVEVTPGTTPSSAPFGVVANFYGEDGNATAARANQLQQTPSFRKNAANVAESQVAVAVSLDKLDAEKTALGDLADIHVLSGKLTQLANSGSREIEAALKSTTMDVDPNSSYGRLSELGHTTSPTLEAFILENNWIPPKTTDELDNFRAAINAPPLPVAKLGNLGGALSWPVPLGEYEQKAVYSHFGYNLKLPGLINDGTSLPDKRGALGYLTKNMQFSASDLRDPLKVIEKIVNTPKARELESALQEKMGEQWQTSSPHDWVLTAIATTLDQESMFRPQLNHVAGYNLADDRFNGKPLETIKQGLADHLIKLRRVSAQMAPVAAHLLLARAAPELLVKDIPNNVTYGSTAWVALKAAVARIEAYSPGITAQMTFAQVLAQDAKDPISSSGQAIQSETSRLALIEWGKLHGKLTPRQNGVYPQAQVEQTQKAFQDKVRVLQTALENLVAKVPTQRDAALEELKKKFGAELPYDLPCFRDNSPRGRNSGNLANPTQPNFSLLDFYLYDSPLSRYSNWVSDDARFPTRMINQLSSLPDPKAKHQRLFNTYKKQYFDASATIIKNQIASLPTEDRKNLEFGKLRVFTEGEVTKSTRYYPGGNIQSQDKTPRQPQDKRSLIFQTERGGNLEFYEMSSQQGKITKRDDLKKNFKEGLQGDWIRDLKSSDEVWKNTMIHEEPPTSEQASKQAASPLSVTTPDSFNSARSNYIGERVTAHCINSHKFDELFQLTKEITTFDKENAKEAVIQGIVLALIPGATPLNNLLKGNFLEALGDVLSDGILYLTGAAFAKGAGAAGLSRAAGRSGLSRAAGMTSRSFGRGVLGKKPSLPASNGPSSAGAKFANTRQLQQSGMNNAQFREFVKRSDVAEGTYQVGASAERIKATAILDEKTGHWFHYDASRGRPYGSKLDNFTPQTHRPLSTDAAASSAPLNNFEKSLEFDNIIQMGSKMEDLKFIGSEMHVFVDKYKGAKRLNIVSHAAEAKDRLNIVAHGNSRSVTDRVLRRSNHVFVDGKPLSAQELVTLLRNKGVNPSQYDNIKLLVCHAGEGGSHSFARLFQKEVQRPVKAFEGTVSMNFGPTNMTGKLNKYKADFEGRYHTPQFAEKLANDKIKKEFINKIKLKIEKDHGKMIKVNMAGLDELPRLQLSAINYKPVHFH
jgi:hypothetical protein